MPAQPEILPDVPAYPPVLRCELPGVAAQTVVFPPSPQVPLPLIAHLGAGLTLAASPQFAHLVPESLDGFIARFDDSLGAESES